MQPMSISKAGTILFQIYPNIVICLDYRIAIPAFTVLPCKLYSRGRTDPTGARKFRSDSGKQENLALLWNIKSFLLGLITVKRTFLIRLTNEVFEGLIEV